MKPLDIIAKIEQTAPLSFAAQWDNSGVQVASLHEQITHIAVMLDPSLASIETGIRSGADFFLAHHPLSMKPRYPNQQDAYLSTLSHIIKNDCWLYSAHTSLDANPNGPVRWLANALQLSDVTVLDPAALGAEHGFGFIGNLPSALSYNKFCTVLGTALGKTQVQTCGIVPQQVQRVACCPGSGSNLREMALQQGADVFITGDVKYHAALESTLRTLDVGHFCLEEKMMRHFASLLRTQLGIPVTFIESSDPLVTETLS